MISSIYLLSILIFPTNAFTHQRSNGVKSIGHKRCDVTNLQTVSGPCEKLILFMAKPTNDEFWEAQRRMANKMSETLNDEEKLERG